MHDKLHFFSKIIVSMSINVTVFHKPIIRSYINTATQISSLKGLFWSHDEWNKTFWLNIYLNGEKRNYCIFGFHWNRALNTLTGVKFSPHISQFAIVLASTLLGTKAIRRRTIMVFMTEVGDSVPQMRCHCPWLPGVLSNYLYWARAPLLSSLFPRRKSWKNDLASERKGIYLQFAKEAKRTDLFRGSSSLLFFSSFWSVKPIMSNTIINNKRVAAAAATTILTTGRMSNGCLAVAARTCGYWRKCEKCKECGECEQLEEQPAVEVTFCIFKRSGAVRTQTPQWG